MGSARILFVDDEESIRITLPPVLREKGFEVGVAASVAEALAEINFEKFDVLIADLNLAEEGDGFLVVSAMRHIQPQCVNLILTGYPALETALQAIHSQVDALPDEACRFGCPDQYYSGEAKRSPVSGECSGTTTFYAAERSRN
jgi:DNA-binding NtrC family response regulator